MADLVDRVVRAARAWREWSDDGEGYIEAEIELADSVDAMMTDSCKNPACANPDVHPASTHIAGWGGAM